MLTQSLDPTRTPATNLRVRLGDYNLKGQTEMYPHEEFTVRRKVVNENYNPATYQNDIALLELSEEVVYRQHIIPVCLPEKGENFTGSTATVTGWGRTQVSCSLILSIARRGVICRGDTHLTCVSGVCSFTIVGCSS